MRRAGAILVILCGLAPCGLAAAIDAAGVVAKLRLKPSSDLDRRIFATLVEREAYLMGTRVHLAAWDATRAAGLARIDRALAVLERTESQLSTWRRDSAVTALNETPVGRAWQADRSLCGVLHEVAAWHRQTAGAFDPAIGRMLAEWDVHGSGRVPSSSELARARATSGLSRLAFDAERCTVTRLADVTVDVGGFGKGEAIDRAARVLGDTRWMIDLGGQVAVNGGHGVAAGWRVAIAHPRDREQPHVHTTLRHGSLATSGGSERDLVVDGVRVGHILDPRTGQPASFNGSVTVWHPRALVADILSTALFVMGPEEGMRWAEARGLSVCYMIPEPDGRVRTLMTPAFQATVLSSFSGALGPHPQRERSPMPRLGSARPRSARHPSAAAALGAPAWPQALRRLINEAN